MQPSRFMPLARRRRNGGGGTPAAPVIVGVPTISGTENVGQTLTATPAITTGNPTPAITWQWERTGVAISGATSSTYTLVSADEGETLTVVQTATNSEGSDTAESAPTGTIGAALAAPVITGVPTISGTETEGQTLTATPASVAGNPTPTRTWQWERSGSAISGATSSTYTLVAADVGETLTVVQTETNSQGVDSAESAATGTISEAGGDITGGTETTDGADQIHTFTNDGTLTVTGGNVDITYEIIGGGGAANSLAPSRAITPGGGGGYKTGSMTLTPGSYSVVVGLGGQRMSWTAGGVIDREGGNGGDSSFNGVTALGGGRGFDQTNGNGADGGNGGGGGVPAIIAPSSGGSGLDGGFDGGGYPSGGARTGSGGGAGGAGNNGTSAPTLGGVGVTSTISGSSIGVCGGGAGGPGNAGGEGVTTWGAGQARIQGCVSTDAAAGAIPNDGVDGRGGGGGGADNVGAQSIKPGFGPKGGSGIVIVRWTPA